MSNHPQPTNAETLNAMSVDEIYHALGMMRHVMRELGPAHPDINMIAATCNRIAETKLASCMEPVPLLGGGDFGYTVKRASFDRLFCGPYTGRFQALRDKTSFLPREAEQWYTVILMIASTDSHFRDEMRACLLARATE